MDHYREKSSAFFTRIARGICRKQRRSPAPQTSLSTSPLVSSLDRMLIYFPRFYSFPTPRRAHPFHSLSCLPRSVSRRSLHTILFAVSCAKTTLPQTTDAVSTTTQHDMQGDEIATTAMGMGAPRGAWVPQDLGTTLRDSDCPNVRRHHIECFAHGHLSGYQREILLCPSLSLGRG